MASSRNLLRVSVLCPESYDCRRTSQVLWRSQRVPDSHILGFRTCQNPTVSIVSRAFSSIDPSDDAPLQQLLRGLRTRSLIVLKLEPKPSGRYQKAACPLLRCGCMCRPCQVTPRTSCREGGSSFAYLGVGPQPEGSKAPLNGTGLAST